MLHGKQVAGVCALLRECVSLLLDVCRLLGLYSIELLLPPTPVLDHLQLVPHLRVDRQGGRFASELKRTLGRVDYGGSNRCR